MTAFLLALQFMTVITLKTELQADEEDFRRARAWFAVAGAILGAFLAAWAWLLGLALPPAVVAALVVAAWALGTRFLHLDGVADTADALGTTAGPERALAIMKDTRVGAFALAAVVLVLITKFALVYSLAEAGWGAGLAAALVIAPALGRAVASLLTGILPPARGKAGLGAATIGHGGLGSELICGLSALAAAVLLGGWRGLVAAALVAMLALALGLWFQKRIHGFTGDTLGTAIELSELLTLLVFTARIPGL
ncbi:MAG: adenosylcobinamide-GDP ribazoletransferase [Deltaproteobacteria bacterium]|nr:adenosylcobinamide-GDP ribazoletransferase [Deltaproteobacteria bacterium]